MEPTSLGLHFYILLIQKINQILLFDLYNTYDTSLSTTMLVLGKIDKPHHQTIASITIKTNMP
jgi:hypothetical protein